MRLRTNQYKNWWANRKIDWKKEYFDTWDHPHRFLISEVLQKFHWISLIEIGVGGGANVMNLIQTIKGRAMQLGGIDINKDAIEFCSKQFKGGVFHQSAADDIMMSDKSTDVTLSDMTYLYVGPFQIKGHLKELKRITRNHVVLCEMHSESLLRRLYLRFFQRYNVYNYKKLLESLGFYDIWVYKVPLEMWPDTQDRYIIKATVPKRNV